MSLVRSVVRLYPRLVFGLGVVVFGARLPGLADGDWGRLGDSAFQHAWLPLVILAVSVTVRGRSTQHTITAMFGGFFTASFLGHFLGDIAIDAMGDNPWRLAAAVPLIEESAKLIPVLLVAAVWRGRQGTPGILDYGLIGVASGAGFGFHEDGLWRRVFGEGLDAPMGWILPQLHESASGVVAGHAAWSGTVGLALGVVFARRLTFAWLGVPVTFAMVVFDHGSWNNVQLREDWRWLLADGWFPVGVFLGGLVLAFLSDLRSLEAIPSEVRVLGRDVPIYTVTGTADGPVRRYRDVARLLRLSALAAHGRHRSGAPTPPGRNVSEGAIA